MKKGFNRFMLSGIQALSTAPRGGKPVTRKESRAEADAAISEIDALLKKCDEKLKK